MKLFFRCIDVFSGRSERAPVRNAVESQRRPCFRNTTGEPVFPGGQKKYPLHAAGRLVMAAIATAFLIAPAEAANFYCCKDDNGRQVCGDFIPSVCNDRGYRIVNQAGVTIKEVPPPMSKEEKEALAAEEIRKKEELAVLRENQRRNQALLDSYSSVKDIDLALQRNEDENQRLIQISESEILNLKAKKQALLDEASLKKNQDSSDLSRQLEGLNRQILEQEALIEAQKKTAAVLRERFAEDKRRYLELSKPKSQ